MTLICWAALRYWYQHWGIDIGDHRMPTHCVSQAEDDRHWVAPLTAFIGLPEQHDDPESTSRMLCNVARLPWTSQRRGSVNDGRWFPNGGSSLLRRANATAAIALQFPNWALRNIYHHHPESKKRKSSEENSGFIHPYGRYENVVKTRKTTSTIAILWPVKAIFEKRAATVEVDSFVSPAKRGCSKRSRTQKHAKERRRKSAKGRFRVKMANNQVWNNQVWELPNVPEQNCGDKFLWAGQKIGRNFLGIFRASSDVQNDPPNFVRNCSQSITPCLVAGMSKFNFHELLGFGAPTTSRTPFDNLDSTSVLSL